jgi:glycosyltransferase involved in cell wall biosynthesis
MSNPLVSVIIAVKNGERFLASAINSVLEQDYRPIEMIVVDGQSTDKTAQIAQSFAQVRYIQQVNKGVSDAYNVGIDAAKGELVAFLSHDDQWTPDKLSAQVNYLIDHPKIQYTIAKVKFFLEPGHSPPSGFRKELLENCHIGRIMETLVVRKSLFDVIGKFRTDLTTAEDVDWYARANDQGIPMSIIPKVLLHKRVHDTNLSLYTLENNRNLLKALRQSIKRKRGQASEKNDGEQPSSKCNHTCIQL